MYYKINDHKLKQVFIKFFKNMNILVHYISKLNIEKKT